MAVNPDGDWPLERTTSRQGRQVTHGNPRSPLICKAFGPRVFAAVRSNSKYLLTETLTFSMSLIASESSNTRGLLTFSLSRSLECCCFR